MGTTQVYNYEKYIAQFPRVVLMVGINGGYACGVYRQVFEDIAGKYASSDDGLEQSIAFGVAHFDKSSKALKKMVKSYPDAEMFPKTVFMENRTVRHVQKGLLAQSVLEELIQTHLMR